MYFKIKVLRNLFETKIPKFMTLQELVELSIFGLTPLESDINTAGSLRIAMMNSRKTSFKYFCQKNYNVFFKEKSFSE